jgi:hypothetical protein
MIMIGRIVPILVPKVGMFNLVRDRANSAKFGLHAATCISIFGIRNKYVYA